MKTIRIDMISLIAILLIIISLIFLIGYYFVSQINQCVNDPLKFYVDSIKETTNAEGIVGTINLVRGNRALFFETFGNWDFSNSSKTFKVNNSKYPVIENPYGIELEK